MAHLTGTCKGHSERQKPTGAADPAAPVGPVRGIMQKVLPVVAINDGLLCIGRLFIFLTMSEKSFQSIWLEDLV